MEHVFAVVIHGLRHPTDTTSTNAVVLSTGLLPDLGTHVAALSSATVMPILRPEDVSGYNWSSDPRRVIGSGGQCIVKISDLAGEWGSQLIKTRASTTWSIEEGSFSDVATSITVKGKTGAPPVDSTIYWIEGEAVEVEQSGTTASGASLNILTRGACGSRAVKHRLDPHKYKDGNGKDERLLLDSRPDFAAHTFTAQLYLFRLDQFGAVTADYVSRYCYVDGSPSPQRGRAWEIRLRDIGDLTEKHSLGSKQYTVSLSHRIDVTGLASEAPADDVALGIPNSIQIFMTRLEAELLTRECMHHPGIGSIDETLTGGLSTSLASTTDDVIWYLEVEASGKWLYQVIGWGYEEVTPYGQLYANGVPVFGFARLRGTLVDREPQKGILLEGAAISGTTNDSFRDGWSTEKASILRPGEQAAKITLRPVLQMTPVNAFLSLMCSDGDLGTDTYDVMLGRVGLGLPSSWFNLGTTAGTIATIDPGTTDLLKRNQLLTTEGFYALQLSKPRKLSDYLAGDLCLPHALMLGPVATSGKLTLRPWARPQEASPVTLPTQSDIEIEPGSRLPRMSGIRLSSGFDQLKLEPTDQRLVLASDSRAGDEVQDVRIWQAGNQLGLQAITTGSLSLLVAGFLDLYGGSPVVYEVPTSIKWLLDNDIEFLDFVTWSNDDVLSEDGTGVAGVFMILGFTIEWRTGRVMVRIIKDTYEESEVTIPPIATAPSYKPPVMRVTGSPVVTTANTYQVPVQVVGAPASDIGTLVQGVHGILTDAGIIRIIRPAQVTSSSLTGEREGFLEAYGVVTAVTYDPGLKVNYITFTVDNAWNRGVTNYVAQEVLVSSETYLLFTDERAAASNLEGVNIEPNIDQLYSDGNGSNFIKTSGDKPFDRVATRIKQT